MGSRNGFEPQPNGLGLKRDLDFLGLDPSDKTNQCGLLLANPLRKRERVGDPFGMVFRAKPKGHQPSARVAKFEKHPRPEKSNRNPTPESNRLVFGMSFGVA